jgi:copper chaperone
MKPPVGESQMPTASFTVIGMTCGHCVSSVKREVSAIAGVSDVEIQLGTGRVTFDSETVVDIETVRAAVEEAGYELETPLPITRMNLLGSSSGDGCGSGCGCGGH